MRRVDWLINELAKFPADAECYAYEGEVIGIVILKPGEGYGVIYCSESNDEDKKSDLLVAS